MKSYLCCGKPCFVKYALPFIGGLKNSDEFLQKWKGAMVAYKAKHRHLDGQLCKFWSVTDEQLLLGKGVEITQRMDGRSAV